MQTHAEERKLAAAEAQTAQDREATEEHRVKVAVGEILRNLAPELYDEFPRKTTQALGISKYDYRPYHANGRPDVRSLRSLRLTNMAFCQAATPVLFQYSCVAWPCWESRLNITCVSAWTFNGIVTRAPAKTEYKDYRDEHSMESTHLGLAAVIKNFRFDLLGADNLHFQKGGEDVYPDQKKSTLHILREFKLLVPHLTKLEFLSFGVGRWSNWWGDAEDGTRTPTSLLFDTEQREEFEDSLALGSFLFLNSLKLHLPATYSFGVVFEKLPTEVFTGLRHLFLEVTDSTGTVKGTDEHDIWPSSNYLEAYPTNKYAGVLFSAISRCVSLESLTLIGTHLLDGGDFEWKPASFGLTTISFHRIRFSHTTVINLLSPSATTPLSSSKLTKVALMGIELTSGTWDLVFKHLATLPSLSYFCPIDLAYAEHGNSSQYFYVNNDTEIYGNLWTNHGGDHDELIDLVLKLVSKSGGVEKYPSERGEQWMLPGYDTRAEYEMKGVPPFYDDMK